MARRVRRSSGPLDLRSQAILRAVIEEYVTTAAPVGSHALVERYRLGVSSATVRAVLAELEAAGLLMHPHTSRGPRPDRAGLPLLRRVHRGLRAAAPGRAADDPPPVRAGGVRERALVPPRRHDARLGDARRRPRDPGQAQRRAPAPPRPRQHQRPPREPDPRPPRGRAQAGPRSRSTARRSRTSCPPSPTASTSCSTASTAAQAERILADARRRRPGDRPAAPRRRARGARPPGVRRRRDRGAVQRRPAQRHGRARSSRRARSSAASSRPSRTAPTSRS